MILNSLFYTKTALNRLHSIKMFIKNELEENFSNSFFYDYNFVQASRLGAHLQSTVPFYCLP